MAALPFLQVVGTNVDFKQPVKRIHDGTDVQFFLQSRAYRDLTTFILLMNRAVVPRKHADDGQIDAYVVRDTTDDSALEPLTAMSKY